MVLKWLVCVLILQFIYHLMKMKICKPEDVLFMDCRLLPYGNVIFYNGMQNNRDIVKDYLKQKM